MVATCPKCGGIAILVQTREELVEVPDLSEFEGKARIIKKIEEFKCQDLSCEHEFENIIKEPLA